MIGINIYIKALDEGMKFRKTIEYIPITHPAM